MNDLDVLESNRRSAVKIIMRHHAHLHQTNPITPWISERELKKLARYSWTCTTAVHKILQDNRPPMIVLRDFYVHLEKMYWEEKKLHTPFEDVWGDCIRCADDLDQILGEGGISDEP